MFALITGLFAITACQPEVVPVEVTRIVKESTQVEVTRVVTEIATAEVTRQVVSEAPAEEVVVEVTRAPIGSAARPVQLLFPPIAETAVITDRGDVLAETLRETTGKEFVVGVLDSEQAIINTLCGAPQDTIGFLSAAGYVSAAEQCEVQTGSVAVHQDGYNWQTGMLVTRRDSGLNAIEDLEGKSWAVADANSIPDFLAFQALLAEAGIEPGEIITVPGESAAMLAVFAGEADFATAAYVPPIMPFEEQLWDYAEDDPEPYRYLGISPTRSPIGYVIVNGEPEFGGYRLRDARSRIFDVEPEIFDRTQIIALSGQIPNETVAFGRDFSLGLAREVMTVMTDFAASDTCATSLCAADFYNWAGLQSVDDNFFAPIRFVEAELDVALDELLTGAE